MVKFFEKKDKEQKVADLKRKWGAEDPLANELMERSSRGNIQRVKESGSFMSFLQRKYFQQFVEYAVRFQRGEVYKFYDFWKRPEDHIKEWENISIEEYKKKINDFSGKEIYVL